MQRLRKPLFGRYGCQVVAIFCGWELVALIPGSPVPTITSMVVKHRPLGVVLIALLTHHFYLENP